MAVCCFVKRKQLQKETEKISREAIYASRAANIRRQRVSRGCPVIYHHFLTSDYMPRQQDKMTDF